MVEKTERSDKAQKGEKVGGVYSETLNLPTTAFPMRGGTAATGAGDAKTLERGRAL